MAIVQIQAEDKEKIAGQVVQVVQVVQAEDKVKVVVLDIVQADLEEDIDPVVDLDSSSKPI